MQQRQIRRGSTVPPLHRPFVCRAHISQADINLGVTFADQPRYRGKNNFRSEPPWVEN